MIGRDVKQQATKKTAGQHADADTQHDASSAIAQTAAEEPHGDGRDHDAAGEHSRLQPQGRRIRGPEPAQRQDAAAKNDDGFENP